MKIGSKEKAVNNKAKKPEKKVRHYNKKILILVIFLLGIFLIFSTYAWFSTNINVKINTFRMTVNKNGGLFISLDGINYDTSIDITADILLNELKNTYPNHLSQWAANGLIPVSSNGILDSNSYFFDIFYSPGGVLYTQRDKINGFMYTAKAEETEVNKYSRFIAFDVFFKNVTGSPIADNLYIDGSTFVNLVPNEEEIDPDNPDADEEMMGLFNSFRIGIVKVGTTDLEASADTIQNLTCNNNCQSIIYDPNSHSHTDLSIERAQKYGITLVDGQSFPTYGYIREGKKIYVKDTISGTPNLDRYYFDLQSVLTEDEIETPLFSIPDGITKARIYLWIEGQDIDSLETNSKGAELELNLGFFKDNLGYESFN